MQAARRLLRKPLKRQCRAPRAVVTDKLASYGAAKRQVMPSVEHRKHKRLNNRAENSHQPTRRRERQMKRFKSTGHPRCDPHGQLGPCWNRPGARQKQEPACARGVYGPLEGGGPARHGCGESDVGATMRDMVLAGGIRPSGRCGRSAHLISAKVVLDPRTHACAIGRKKWRPPKGTAKFREETSCNMTLGHVAGRTYREQAE